MNARALVIAMLVAGLGVFLLLMYQRKFETDASGGERIKLIMAVKPIERGKVITEDMVAAREIPQAYVEDRAIKDVERGKIVGLRVGTAVQAQQTLLWTDLVTSSEERRDLSSLVQSGSRAVSIRTSREDSSVALIRPGDYVDVISVLAQGNANAEQRAAVVLLQRVLVLAVGHDTSPDQPAGDKAAQATMSDRDSLLTMSVTLPEAQLLSLAAEKGRIAVALRNPEDQRTAERVPDISSNSLLDTNQREQIKGVRRGASGPQRLNTTEAQ
jgi:pilus assembly protein CpaB